MALPVNFYTGTYEEYKALEGKASNALFFCEDEKLIFQGDSAIPVPYRIVTSKPSTEGVENLLYFNNNENLIYVFDKSSNSYKTIYGEYITSIGYFNETIKRIKYNPQTRTIILPQITNNSTNEITNLTINLGKDEIIDSAYYDNDPTSDTYRNIVLIFKTMDTTDDTQPDAKHYVYIPVNDLIDIYTGGITDSISVSIVDPSENNSVDERTVTATLKLHTATVEEKANAIQLFKDGIYVDVNSYTDSQIGDLGNNKSNVPFETVSAAIQQAQQYADKGIADAAAANANAETRALKTTTINNYPLSNDINLVVGDISGAAPINSPILTGAPKAPTFQDSNWQENENKDLIATVSYVNNAITVANTWGEVSKRYTWGQMKEGGY